MKKIGDSFKGILGGIIMLIIGVVLLWWNEGNNVKNIKTTAELEKIYIDVKSDSIDSKNEGKLVATNGKLINEKELTDIVFGVTIKTPIMKRTVEMYQWEEDKQTDDNDKTKYVYEKEWTDEVIDSSEFHDAGHDNPTQKLYENKTYTSDDVRVGAFALTNEQVNKLSTNGSYTDFASDKLSALNFKENGKYITNSVDVDNPEVGDIRITFDYNDSTEISVLAVQNGNSFVPFTSSAGKTVSRVMDGAHTGKEMIEQIKSENKFLKWIFRGLGALLCILGFAALLGPISTIASFVPILGRIVGTAVGAVSFICGLSLSLIVIAIAWIRFRPVLGISLLLIATALIVLLIVKGKKNDTPTENTNNS